MTGVVLFGSGGLAWGIGGVTSAGGRITPPVRSNRSLKLSPGRVSERVERGSWGPDLAPLSSSALGTEAVEASPTISPIATATMRNVGRSQAARRARGRIVAGLHVAVAMSSSPSKVNLRAGTWFCRGARTSCPQSHTLIQAPQQSINWGKSKEPSSHVSGCLSSYDLWHKG